MDPGVLYFISDTHLGDGTAADRFLYHDPLLDLLARVEQEEKAHLVLLGDLLELWSSSLEAILVRHAPLLLAMERVARKHPVTYVVGNHDCLPWYYFVGQRLGGIQITERFTALRGAVVALHGHQFDPFNQVRVSETGQVKAPWTRRLVQVVGFLGRTGGERTADAIAGISEWLGGAAVSLEALLPGWREGQRRSLHGALEHTRQVLARESPGERGYPAGESRYAEGALALLRAGARWVLMGHTHHPVHRKYGQKEYVNTGCWVWNRYPPTYARLERGQMQLLNAHTHAVFEPVPPGSSGAQ